MNSTSVARVQVIHYTKNRYRYRLTFQAEGLFLRWRVVNIVFFITSKRESYRLLNTGYICIEINVSVQS